MQSLEGIREIINKYEVFILDQWGVIHDGNKGYAHAIKCINYLKTNNKKVNLIGHRYDPAVLIKIYDNHNIFILPSFTEAHPKVIDESLARMRPVIIFKEIQHVIQNRKGIIVSKRNVKSLLETIDFIMKNYINIQESMTKNKLPTKKEFISQMSNILSSN